jgi:hypothetical protein
MEHIIMRLSQWFWIVDKGRLCGTQMESATTTS